MGTDQTRKIKVILFQLTVSITVLLVILFIIMCRDKALLKQTALVCHTKTISNNIVEKYLLLSTLKTIDKKDLILLKNITEDGDRIIIETIYDSDELNAYFETEAINSVDDFNRFIKSTDFEPVPVCYSPIDLFVSHKGNCYAYTLFTMFYLSKYHPELSYEPIFEYYEDGDSHIYLLIKNDKNQVVCDLTKDRQLVLPE